MLPFQSPKCGTSHGPETDSGQLSAMHKMIELVLPEQLELLHADG